MNKAEKTHRRRNYDDKFKEDVVQYLLESGKSANEVARERGLDASTLSRWKRKWSEQQAQRSGAVTKGPTLSELKEENRRLRAQVRDLEEEKKILKKALRLCA